MATAFSNVPVFTEGTLLHKVYYICNKIGEGSFGRVYKAYKKDTNEVVAIKQTLKSELSSNYKLEELYKTEVSVMKSIQNDNIIKYIDNFNTKDSCFLVMEYCNQGELSLMLQKYKRFPEETVIEYLKQILNGFKALHKIQVVHRDLKPDNILIHQQQLKISDFGFAKQLSTNPTTTCLGTPTTMAPEVLLNKPYGLEVDVFSLGVIIYKMLYGEYPYRSNIINLDERIQEFIRNIQYDVPGVVVSDSMKDLLKRMICFTRANRIKWHEIYQHEIVNTQSMGNSKIIFPQSMIMKPDNRKEAIKLYEQFKDLYVNDDDANDKNQPKKLNVAIDIIDIIHENEDILDQEPSSPHTPHKQEYEQLKQSKLRQESIHNCINQTVLQYVHYKSVYVQIFKTIKSIISLPRPSRNQIVLYLLSKKLYDMTLKMDYSLKQKSNIFNIKYFEDFLKTENYNQIYNDFIGNVNDFKMIFEQAKIDATSFQNILIQENKNELKKRLNYELQNVELSNYYNDLFIYALAYSYQKMNQQLSECQTEQQKLLYFQSFLMTFDILEEEKVFGNLMFDFIAYNYQIQRYSFQNIQQQFQERASKYNLDQIQL